MKKYLDYISEITIKQGKEVFQDAEHDKQRQDELYKELFNNPSLDTDKRKYRIYVDFNYDGDDPNEEHSKLEATIKSKIAGYYTGRVLPREFRVVKSSKDIPEHKQDELYDKVMNYDFHKKGKFDYKSGTFIGWRGNVLKIGKTLQQAIDDPESSDAYRVWYKELLTKFNEDTDRSYKKKAEYKIVITKMPIDIIKQSTERNWTSCMDLNRGCNPHYVPKDLKHGTILGYLIFADDLQIKNPIARVSIKPYRKGKDTYLFTSEYTYNTITGGRENKNYNGMMNAFRDNVNKFIDKYWNSEVKDGIYDLDINLYPDDIKTVNNNPTLIKKLKEKGYKLYHQYNEPNNYFIVEKNGKYYMIDDEINIIKEDVIGLYMYNGGVIRTENIEGLFGLYFPTTNKITPCNYFIIEKPDNKWFACAESNNKIDLISKDNTIEKNTEKGDRVQEVTTNGDILLANRTANIRDYVFTYLTRDDKIILNDIIKDDDVKFNAQFCFRLLGGNFAITKLKDDMFTIYNIKTGKRIINEKGGVKWDHNKDELMTIEHDTKKIRLYVIQENDLKYIGIIKTNPNILTYHNLENIDGNYYYNGKKIEKE